MPEIDPRELSRYLSIIRTTVPIVAGAVSTLCEADSQRVALMLGVPSTNICNLGIGFDATVGLGFNFQNNQGFPSALMSQEDFGPIVQERVTAFGTGGNFDMTVIQLVIRSLPSLLNARINDEFRRQQAQQIGEEECPT